MATARAQNIAPPSSKFADSAIADAIGALATTGLLQELAAWPKPGLVSHRDSGSHRDMDASTLQASAAALALELGPRPALSRMVAQIFPAGSARALEDFRSIEGARAWLARG